MAYARRERRDAWKEVEQGLSSVGKIKILRVLLKDPEEAFTRHGLSRVTGLKPLDVRNNLKTLTQMGWVREYPYDPKTYKINLENQVVRVLSGFFRQLNRPILLGNRGK